MNSLGRRATRRAGAAALALFGIVTLSFLLIHFIPGDPIDAMLGEQASAIDREALRAQLGLDRPLSEQYARFWLGLARLDLGRSLAGGRPVAAQILERAPATAELAFASMGLALAFGVPLGAASAFRRGGWLDRATVVGALAGASIPTFWLGPMLILVLAIKLDWLPVSERGGWAHLALPALTLATGLASVLALATRAATLETLNEDYLTVARAKGVGPWRLCFRHALANAASPILTIAGLQFGAVLTGAAIVETIFDWPGVGDLLFQAIQKRDYPTVQGCVLAIAIAYALVNLAVDAAYGLADPRSRADA